MQKFITIISGILMLTWISGCVSGVYLDNTNLTNAGAISFLILILLDIGGF